MDKDTLIEKLKAVKTKPELDALRMDCAKLATAGHEDDFLEVQQVFRKAANRVRRVPLKDRTW